MSIRLARTEVEGSLDWHGEPCAFRVRSWLLTGEFEDRIKAAQSNLELAGLLAELVSWIDISIDDEGTLIECSAAEFHRLLPTPLLKGLWQEVGKITRPDPQTGSN